jgi:hypothetical protein
MHKPYALERTDETLNGYKNCNNLNNPSPKANVEKVKTIIKE